MVLSWPETAAGALAVVPCPSSNATRQCGSEGMWLNPDTTTCTGLEGVITALTNELTMDNLEEQVQVFAVALSSSVDNPEQQTLEVLEATADYFNHVVVVVGDIVNNNSDSSTVSPVVVDGLVQSLSSLQQWEPSVISGNDDSSRIIMYFEFVAAQFADQEMAMFNVTEEGIIIVAENLDLNELVTNGRSVTFGSNEFSSTGALEDGFVLPEGVVASVSLPPSLFATIDDRDLVGVFFALYEAPTLFPVREGEQLPTSSLPAVASSVVAATVGPGLEFMDLVLPVEVNLRIINDFEDVSVRNGSERCVSWDFAGAGGEGNWTTEGCVTAAVSDDGVVTCLCNHLTNFAILVDICTRVRDCETNEVVERILGVVSIVGVVLSLVGLTMTVIRDRDNSKYHIQLSIAIYCMLLVFVSGIEQTAVYGGCVVVSVLIHYFSLAAVMWMGAEATLMFHVLVVVYKKVTKKEMIVTAVVCWVAPLFAVVIPLAIDLSNGIEPENDLIVTRSNPQLQFCFLNNPIVFGVAFLGPILAVVTFNVIVYVVVITILIKHTRSHLAHKSKSHNSKTVIRLMVSIAGVMFLFGLSWLFGALTITVTAVRLTFQILFAIFTSLQGFFIFLFFCVFSKDAREHWKETLSCGRYKSKFLNPQLKFITANKHRSAKNSTSAEVAPQYHASRSAVTTFKDISATSTENIMISRAESLENHYIEQPTTADLGQNTAQDFASVVDSEGGLIDIEMYSNPQVQ